jgi:hypothetical protein
MPDNSTITFMLSKKKISVLFFGSILFVVSGFIVLNKSPDPKNVLIGWSGIVFFGLCAVYLGYKLFDKKAAVIINNEGIIDNSSGAAVGLVKWARISGAEEYQIYGHRILKISILEPEKFIEGLKGSTKLLAEANYKLFGSPIHIASNTLSCNFDTLKDEIQKRIKK